MQEKSKFFTLHKIFILLTDNYNKNKQNDLITIEINI